MKLPNSFRGAPIKYQSVQKHVFLQPWDDRIFPTALGQALSKIQAIAMSGQTLNESIARVSNNIASPRSVYSVFMYQTCSLYMFIWNDVVHCFPNLGTLVAHHSQKQPRVQSWPSHGGFHEWGYPHSWMVFFVDNRIKMDDGKWGVHVLRVHTQ